jgi:hypothetical protein
MRPLRPTCPKCRTGALWRTGVDRVSRIAASTVIPDGAFTPRASSVEALRGVSIARPISPAKWARSVRQRTDEPIEVKPAEMSASSDLLGRRPFSAPTTSASIRSEHATASSHSASAAPASRSPHSLSSHCQSDRPQQESRAPAARAWEGRPARSRTTLSSGATPCKGM